MWGKKSDIYVCTGMRGYGIYIVKGDKDRKRGRCLLDVTGIANTPLDPYIHIYINTYIHPYTSRLPYPNKPPLYLTDSQPSSSRPRQTHLDFPSFLVESVSRPWSAILSSHNRIHSILASS